MGYSLKVVGETFERGCAFPASFNIVTTRKRKGRFSVSVSSVGTALPTYLVPKGCSKRALLRVAPGNSPSSQSCQSTDFSDARRKQGSHPTIKEKTKSQAFKQAPGTQKTLSLYRLKQSSEGKVHPSSVLSASGQAGQCRVEARAKPFLPTSSLDKGGRSPSEVHAHSSQTEPQPAHN